MQGYTGAAAGRGNTVLLKDEKSSGTNGGTFTSGAKRVRDLNVEAVDDGNLCTLASNVFTLAAGTWDILAFVPAYACGNHTAFLHSLTSGTDRAIGTPGYCPDASAPTIPSIIMGRFTIAVSEAFEIQHQCATTIATYGFGVASGYGVETYTVVHLKKVL